MHETSLLAGFISRVTFPIFFKVHLFYTYCSIATTQPAAVILQQIKRKNWVVILRTTIIRLCLTVAPVQVETREATRRGTSPVQRETREVNVVCLLYYQTPKMKMLFTLTLFSSLEDSIIFLKVIDLPCQTNKKIEYLPLFSSLERNIKDQNNRNVKELASVLSTRQQQRPLSVDIEPQRSSVFDVPPQQQQPLTPAVMLGQKRKSIGTIEKPEHPQKRHRTTDQLSLEALSPAISLRH